MTDERAVCFNAIGRFPEVGDEIKNIDFLHSDEIQWVLTGRIFEGLRGSGKLKAESLKLVGRAISRARFAVTHSFCERIHFTQRPQR